MRAVFFCVALAAGAGGCVVTPKDPPVWVRTDGRSMVGRPALQSQFQIDSAICQGEMAKVAGAAPVIYYQGLGGLISAAAISAQRNELYAQVGVGCMAERGYVLSSLSKAGSVAADFKRISGRP